MINLQVDFSLLNKFFGVTPAKAVQYANKDFKEIMELEAAQGNSKAAEYKKILSDPDKIQDIFKLANVENKFIILQNMSEADLDNLLPYLKQDQLSRGLQFFTEEKLIAMCKEVPMEALLEMIFEKFQMMDILKLMEDDAMNEFIMQPEVERKYAQKYMETLDNKTLEKIMMQSFGSSFEGKSKDEYLLHLEELSDDDYKRFMVSMEREQKMFMINGIVDQEADLLMLFKPDDLVRPMEMLMKGDKIKMMSKLDPEFLVPMIQELPIDLTQIVLTQIDPKEFSEILAEDFQDILSSVVLFTRKAG
ncbi:MAG: hypothetical protein IKU37_00120 [Candidatus Gastranaerophilales bacterium]|nr:hypothetical protein [Candidatus Gastranaerophilales bacterium]